MPNLREVQDWYRKQQKLVRIGSIPYAPSLGTFSGAYATFVALAPATDPTNLPTGAGYTPFMDLYNPVNDYRSDTGTIDAYAVLNRCPVGNIVTVPETKNMTPSGAIMCEDFMPDPYQAGIFIPSKVRGIIGSGRGTLGSTASGTIFTMRPGSSTKGNGATYTVNVNGQPVQKLYIPVQDNNTPTQLNVMKHLSPYPWTGSPVFKNFQVAGTEQGHIFSAFQIYGTPGPLIMDGILITGWDGNNGAPPGETSALAVNGIGAHQVSHVEVDGRRTPGGTVFGGMGMTFQNSVGAKFSFCNVHHTRVAAFVLYQAFYCELEDCVFDATYTPNDRSQIGNGAMNLERAAASKLTRVTFGGRTQKLHTTLSGDAGYTLNQAGVSYNYGDIVTRDGSLSVIDPAFNDLWGNNRFMIQSWIPYLGSSVMGNIAVAPKVVTSTGQRVATNWISDVTYEQAPAYAWRKQ